MSNIKNHGVGAGVRALLLRTEDPGLILRTFTAAHNHLQLWIQRLRFPLLASKGTGYKHGALSCMQADVHTNKLINIFKSPKGTLREEFHPNSSYKYVLHSFPNYKMNQVEETILKSLSVVKFQDHRGEKITHNSSSIPNTATFHGILIRNGPFGVQEEK